MYNILNVSSSINSVLMNVLNANQQKKIVLDPLTTISRLALLNFQEPGTKLGIDGNKIVYYHPSLTQGITRFFYGDKRSDLSNLFTPTQLAIKWYNPFNNPDIDTDPENTIDESGKVNQELVMQNIELLEKNFTLQIIFKIAHMGLIKLKAIYGDSNSPTYILLTIIDNILTGKPMDLEEDVIDTKDAGDKYLHKCLQNLWTESDINIVCELLKKLQEEENIDLKNNYIKTLDVFLSGKEKTVTQIITNYTTKL